MTAIRETDRETEKLIKNNMFKAKKQLLSGPFRRGVLSHVHVPTHVQKRLEAW